MSNLSFYNNIISSGFKQTSMRTNRVVGVAAPSGGHSQYCRFSVGTIKLTLISLLALSNPVQLLTINPLILVTEICVYFDIHLPLDTVKRDGEWV